MKPTGTTKGLTRLSGMIALAAMLSSCGLTEAGLRQGTAREVGRITSDQVRISNIDRGVVKTRWTARTPRGRYRCEADQAMINITCVRG